MSDLLPLATYNLNIEPYTPTPAIDVTRPVTVRITMAALNPEAYDDEKKPSTLRIVKRNPDFDDEDDILNGDYDEEELDEEDEEEEEEEKPKKKKKSKEQEKEEEDEEEEEDEDEDDEDDEFEEYVLLTLSPKGQYQQSVDITIAPEEDVQFVVTGSYAISLSGNYIKHPFDAVNMDEDEEDDEEGQYYDSDEYDLTPDEDEIIDDELDDLEEEVSDAEARVEELVEEKEQEQEKKPSNKRKQEEKPEPEAKKAKKEKKAKPAAEKEKKKVEFKKELEEGPTKKAQEKPKTKTKVLEGGVIIEDRTVGKGAQAKKSSKVGMRYIGKLKNGKVFDKNTSGKPFVFKLGHGEVIKGWDIGVAGMAVGGERRIIIPAPYAYGKQALPGIPANSELTFDVKLVSLK